MVYAVIDTNVLVSALIAVHPDSATVIIRDKIAEGVIVPLFNEEIFDEYRTVLSRPKFDFPTEAIVDLLEMIRQCGLSIERTKSKVSSSIDEVLYVEDKAIKLLK